VMLVRAPAINPRASMGWHLSREGTPVADLSLTGRADEAVRGWSTTRDGYVAQRATYWRASFELLE